MVPALRFVPRALLARAALALALAAAPAAAPAAQVEDPLTGTWSGRATGQPPMVPPEGIPFELRVRRVDERTARVRLDVDGTAGDEVDATYDPEEARLAFRASFQGIVLGADLTLEGERLAGTIGGLGLSVDARAERTSRDVPRGEDEEPAQPVDLAQLTAEDWLADLDALAARLPERHVNAFHTLSEEQWRAAVLETRAALPGLDPLGSAVALARLVARVGDAHTELAWNVLPGLDHLPVRFRAFADGLFVTAVDQRWEGALAARVLRVGRVPADEALAAVATLFAAENEAWRRAKAPSLLSIPRLLVALGVAEAPDRLPLVVESEPGVEHAFVVELAGSGTWLSAPDPALDPVPLWQRRTGEGYWFEEVDAGTLYLAYNRCAEDPARPIAPFVDQLFAAFDAGVDGAPLERLVVDLRHNSGGNSAVLQPFLQRAAAHPRLRERGTLVALIGPSTYSSGMLNALELRRIGAVLVGEPTGGKPNSYGELRSFPLPRSGLRVFHSTKYFRLLEEDPPTVAPDVLVELGSEDHFFGRDPVLERVLAGAAEPSGR